MKLTVTSTPEQVAVESEGLDSLDHTQLLRAHAILLHKISQTLKCLLDSCGYNGEAAESLLMASVAEPVSALPVPPHLTTAFVRRGADGIVRANCSGEGRGSPQTWITVHRRMVIAVGRHAVALLSQRGIPKQKAAAELVRTIDEVWPILDTAQSTFRSVAVGRKPNCRCKGKSCRCRKG